VTGFATLSLYMQKWTWRSLRYAKSERTQWKISVECSTPFYFYYSVLNLALFINPFFGLFLSLNKTLMRINMLLSCCVLFLVDAPGVFLLLCTNKITIYYIPFTTIKKIIFCKACERVQLLSAIKASMTLRRCIFVCVFAWRLFTGRPWICTVSTRPRRICINFLPCKKDLYLNKKKELSFTRVSQMKTVKLR
jgi:hypothetical protein